MTDHTVLPVTHMCIHRWKCLHCGVHEGWLHTLGNNLDSLMLIKNDIILRNTDKLLSLYYR